MNFEGAAALSWYVITRATYSWYFSYWSSIVFLKHNARDWSVNDQFGRKYFLTSSVEVTWNKVYIIPSFTMFAWSSKQIKYGKKTVPQSKTAERITIPKRYLTILTNNSHGIFLIKQFNELTLSNQTGQTQKWVSFQKKVLTRLFQQNTSCESISGFLYTRRKRKAIGKRKKKELNVLNKYFSHKI